MSKIKYSLWNRQMKKVFLNNIRKKRMLSIDQAHKIGIVFCYSKENAEVVDSFIKFLKQKHISTLAIAYIDDYKKNGVVENSDISYYYRDDIGFNMIPVNEIVDSFVKDNFDILIDLSNRQSLQNLYLSNVSVASFKIGRNNSSWANRIFDFSIGFGNDEDVRVEMLIHTILDYSPNFDISK